MTRLEIDKGRTLHLVVKHKFFDAIKDGKKHEEYRDNTPYWRKRIFGTRPDGSEQKTLVTFHRGYTKTTMTFEIDYIVWGEQVEIHLGKRIK